MARYTWRKGKEYDGMRVLASTYELRCGSNEVLAYVQQLKDGRWYWYGDGMNSCGHPVTLPLAKEAAVLHFKQSKRRK